MSIYICNECYDAAFQHLNREIRQKLVLSGEEAKALDDYFTKRAGYISHEFDAPVHDIISKIQKFLRTRHDND